VLLEGRWSGELDGAAGSLVITRVDGPRSRGLFQGEGRQLALVIDRSAADAGGAWLPSNRALVAWLDGHGGEGRGWLLVDAQGRAITGALGFGTDYTGAGTFAFVREPD
jgi:hypothetical protein